MNIVFDSKSFHNLQISFLNKNSIEFKQTNYSMQTYENEGGGYYNCGLHMTVLPANGIFPFYAVDVVM